MTNAERCVGPFVHLGYSYWAKGVEPGHRLFVRLANKKMTARTHNLHLVEIGGPYRRSRLLFRDYSRGNPETARAYARLKQELAHQYRDDREAYTATKSGFVSGIVRRARHNLR